ncbi:phosphoethanolamine transferase [Proteus mirabilis]|uniref:phosphoethanolamine transferase n=1 Tax=Proteus mirabilis TaxID=584 RepID=UPI00257535AE|nr:phosphoethanolamine transferase [Proteus mirabilis]MDM3594576.1 phosphoethanolamine transferase [Proteus mirabilis]
MLNRILDKNNIITIALSIIISVISYYGMGFSEVSWKLIISILLVYITSKNKLTIILSSVSLFILSFYFYTGFIYGFPNIGYIASLFETNLMEAYEFILGIKYEHILIYFIFYLSIILNLINCYKFNKNSNLFIILLISAPLIYTSPYYLFSKQTAKTIKQYYLHKDSFIESLNKKPSWEIYEDENKDKDLIVIIGESVRKDFMSLYGFKHKNTPFLESANGYFIDGYISTAPNTSHSLQRTLAKVDHSNIKEEDNVVTLANAAGFDTFWISNQGFTGYYDTPITRIALRSKHPYFLKDGDYGDKNIDDLELINILNLVLKDNKKRKVIFIHMMGSHPQTCYRLHGFPLIKYGNSEDLDCYIATIAKLDSFIENIKSTLDNYPRDYSIVYFSDHGTQIREDGTPVVGSKFKQNYEVPFFIINRTDNSHVNINKNISAYNFIDIYENILGIKTKKDSEYFDILEMNSNNDVEVFNWKEMIKFNSLKDQPANDVTK